LVLHDASHEVHHDGVRRKEMVAVFVMTNTASNETELVQANGFYWSQVMSAQVMYATETNVSEGPAQITTLPSSCGNGQWSKRGSVCSQS
jgi:hypothetical protein